MKEIICTICPNSCKLQIDEKTMRVTGQLCPRGEAYAKQELLDPQRTLTTSVKTIFEDRPVVSVRTSGAVSKRLIKRIMLQLKPIVIDKRLPRGSVIVENVADSGVDVITTSSLIGGFEYE